MDLNTLNARLTALLKYDVRTILAKHRQEYIDLYTYLEGRKPACASCGAKTTFARWKKKYKNGVTEVVKKPIVQMTNNTFTLKKGRQFISLPFSSGIITKNSPDELVLSYLNKDLDSNELERRKSFFDKLPDEPKKKRKRRSKAEIEAEKEALQDLEDMNINENKEEE